MTEPNYKEMWFELKKRLQDVLNELTDEYNTFTDEDASLRDIDETLAAMEAHRCVLDCLEYIEWERENPTLAKETVAERVLRLWEEEKFKGKGNESNDHIPEGHEAQEEEEKT